MGYLIAAIVVVLLVGGFVAFLVLNATRKSSPAATAQEGAPGMGRDATPLGDTSEHAGRHSDRGTTLEDPETHPPSHTGPDSAAHVARPGEGEGRERLEFEGEQPKPASERLADRER